MWDRALGLELRSRAEKEHAMEIVQSADGTRIAYERSGDGPPLVLVHGTSADHTRWAGILPALAARFTVFAMDRRGRGESGDGAGAYRIEDEFADVAAVVGAAGAGGPRVTLLGHSYGAICALEAALRTPHLNRLILYEPPIARDGMATAPALLAHLQALLAAGDRDGVVETFFREGPGVPPHELTRMKSLPSWQSRVAAAHTIPRELRASSAYAADPERIRAIAAPTLLLLGSDSPATFKATTETLHSWLPDSQVAVLANQQHSAMLTAPDLFATEVIRFLAA